MIVRQKIVKWVCFALTLCMLIGTGSFGAVYANEEVAITSPAAGSFLEMGDAVTVCVASASEPTLTAGDLEVFNPTKTGDGIWEFSWVPETSGVVTLKASEGTVSDSINTFVGVTGAVSLRTAVEGEDTLIIPDGISKTAEAVVLAFDVTFAAESDTMTISHQNGTVIGSLSAADETGAVAVGTHRIKVIFDRTLGKQVIYTDGKQVAQTDMASEELGAILFSGAAVSNPVMRQSAEPEISITAPLANQAVYVGDSLEVRVKTTGLIAGQTIKVVAKDGAEAEAIQVPGSADEYVAVFEHVTAGFQTLTAVVESEGLSSNEVPLDLYRDALLRSWDFNDGTAGAAGNLDAAEELFWNDDFIYQPGKDGEGMAAYRTAPTGGAWQGDGLVINYKTPPVRGRAIFAYDARMDGKVMLRMRNSSGAYTDILSFNGQGGTWSDLNQTLVSDVYTPGAWQKHKLIFDLDHQTLDFYVDGVLKIEKLQVSQLANTLTLVTWAVNRSDKGGIAAYMDNLKVFVTQKVSTGGGGSAESVAFVSPISGAFLEKGRPVGLKVTASGADRVDFYANEKQIGSAAVVGNIAAYSWTPDMEGSITLKAVAGAASDEMTVETVQTEEFYYDALLGPKIVENDNINTWGGLQNFDRYQSGGPDGGNYGVMTGSGANKSILWNGSAAANANIYMVEMNVRFPAGTPAAVGLGNYHEGLGTDEMFYIGSAGSGYHDGDGNWIATDSLPADTWVNIKYIENVSEAVRTIYADGILVYSGPAFQDYGAGFGGLSVTMNKNWTSEHEFHVDNLRISTATAPLFVRSASMVNNGAIRVTFSKAVSRKNLERAVTVFRGIKKIPVTVTKSGRCLDLAIKDAVPKGSSAEYTVKIADTLMAEDGTPLKKSETLTVRSIGQFGNVTEIGWTKGGTPITSLRGLGAGDEVGFACSQSGASAVRTILCVYTKNADGSVTLKQSAVSKTETEANAAAQVLASITLEQAIGESDCLKVFLLDADTLIPLADPIVIEAN